jgi:hypothetical protein
MWTRALVVFSILALIFASVGMLIHQYLYRNLFSFLSYELPSLPYFFPYQPHETFYNLDIDEATSSKCLFLTLIFEGLVMLEATYLLVKLFRKYRIMEGVMD